MSNESVYQCIPEEPPTLLEMYYRLVPTVALSLVVGRWDNHKVYVQGMYYNEQLYR